MEPKAILIVGASRGIGLGLVQEYLARNWQVIATVRNLEAPALQALSEGAEGRLRIEVADIDHPDDFRVLCSRLGQAKVDVIFLVAGISGPVDAPIHDVLPEDAARVFLTNAYGPVTAAERLLPLLRESGIVAFMSSRLASMALNTNGTWETYRASKAALNALVQCFYFRHKQEAVSCVLLAPGWVRTDMGGPEADIDVRTSARALADRIAERVGETELVFLDHDRDVLPW